MSNHIARQTFLLDHDNENVVATVVLVARATDGEIFTVTVTDHREAERMEDSLESVGSVVLVRVEGEHDLGTGERSVWAKY